MDLKFSFGASNPLPLASEGAGSASLGMGPGSSVLEMQVSYLSADSIVRCEGVSGDGVNYAQAEKHISGEDAATLAAAFRSVLARCGAELPEPLIGSVTAVTVSFGGAEEAALAELGLTVSATAQSFAQVDEALQARTGITAGTPILRR